jgi:hypothetical protein
MTPKKLHRNLGTKNIQARQSPSMEDIQPHWKSMWREKAQHDERAEWIREQRMKINNMDWVTKELWKPLHFCHELATQNLLAVIKYKITG